MSIDDSNIKIREKTYIYIRVSTAEQARDQYGLEMQERECRRFCDERGWKVAGVYKDIVSGWDGDARRPEFEAMMYRACKNRDGNVLVYEYSRFGRNTLLALEAYKKLDEAGIFTTSVRYPGADARTAAGRTARRNELSTAEDFSDQHSEKTSARMKAAFEDGRWGRPAMLGYQNTRLKIKGQPNIVPLEPEAGLVKRAFEFVAEGNERTADVLRKMTALGLQSKKGNKLCLTAFLDMLRNPAYIGQIRSDKYRKTVKGLHQPIVDETLFKNVQLILSGKKPIVAPYQMNRPEFPLRRFLRCAVCGCPLTGGFSTSATGRKHPYYHCYRCRTVKSLSPQKAHDEFTGLLERLEPTAFLSAEFPAVLKEEWAKRTGDSTAMVAKLKADLKERKALQEKLLLKYLNDDPNVVPVYESTNRRLQEEIAGIEAQIAEADTARATIEELIEFSKTTLANISEAWNQADVDGKQRVQNILFPEGLKYHPEKGILNANNDCLFNQLEGVLGGKLNLVRPERFERPTYWFVASCSIQLSYGRTSLLYYCLISNARLLVRRSPRRPLSS